MRFAVAVAVLSDPQAIEKWCCKCLVIDPPLKNNFDAAKKRKCKAFLL